MSPRKTLINNTRIQTMHACMQQYAASKGGTYMCAGKGRASSLEMARARMPMLVSCGGLDECPGTFRHRISGLRSTTGCRCDQCATRDRMHTTWVKQSYTTYTTTQQRPSGRIYLPTPTPTPAPQKRQNKENKTTNCTHAAIFAVPFLMNAQTTLVSEDFDGHPPGGTAETVMLSEHAPFSALHTMATGRAMPGTTPCSTNPPSSMMNSSFCLAPVVVGRLS